MATRRLADLPRDETAKTDVASSIEIRVKTMTTGNTGEVMAPPLATGSMPATATRRAGGSILNMKQGQPHVLGFVGQQGLKLVESPGVKEVPLLLSTLGLRSDSLEVFKGNGGVIVGDGEVSDPSARDMVGVTLHPLFSARQPFLGAPDGTGVLSILAPLCLFRLENAAPLAVTAFEMLNATARHEESLGVAGGNGQVILAPVDADNPTRRSFRLRDFTRNEDGEENFAVHCPEAARTDVPTAILRKDLLGELAAIVESDALGASIEKTQGKAGLDKREITACLSTLEEDGSFTETHVTVGRPTLNSAKSGILAGNIRYRYQQARAKEKEE